jgi:ribosomal protein S18 acetylase RimI-like enzyme
MGEAAERLRANFAAWIPLLGLLPGGRVGQHRGVTWWTSDAPAPLLNGVYGNPPDVEAIDAVLAHFVGRPVLWSASHPTWLDEELRVRGFGIAHIPGMVLKLDALPPLDHPTGVAVHEVDEDRELLEIATRISFLTNAFPDFVVPAVMEMLDRLPHRQQFRTFLATVDGEPAAASAVLISDHVAGIYDVGTLPQYRRRGLGRLVSLAALHRGREAGCDLGALESSREGEAVYKSLGFEECCRFTFAVRV